MNLELGRTKKFWSRRSLRIGTAAKMLPWQSPRGERLCLDQNELRIKNNKKLLNCFIVLLSCFIFLFLNYNNAKAEVKCICSGSGLVWEETASKDCSDGNNSAMGVTCVQAGLVPAPSGGGEGDYTLNDFIKVAINIAAWILSITGSLALLFFIYGGFMFLISAGSSERVQKAKQIIIGAVVGVVIVLTSFLIINFIIESLTGSNQINGKEWFRLL